MILNISKEESTLEDFDTLAPGANKIKLIVGYGLDFLVTLKDMRALKKNLYVL